MGERIGELTIARRRFGAIALGGACAAVVGGGLALWDNNADTVRFFDVVHDESVYVTMTNGAEFVVEVKQVGTREVLERHEGVTARSLHSLKSERLVIIKLDRR